jgi:Flp pilus assembly CpaE family ATPase
VRGYLEFHELFAKSEVHVVLWGVTNDSESKDVRAAVSRHTGIESIFETAYDFDVMRKALTTNTFVGCLDSKNKIAKEFESIAKMLQQNLELQTQSKVRPQKLRRNLLKRAA